MAKDIGPRIGIDGEKEYRAAINQIIQQAKTLDSEMRLVASGFDKTTTAEEKTAATQKILSEQIKTQEERVRLLKEQYAKAAETLGENDTKTLQWKQAVIEAETQLNGLNKQLGELDGEMQEAGDETEKTGKKTAEAGKKAEDAGTDFKKFGEIAKEVGKVAAAAIGAVVTTAAAVGKEMWNLANQVSEAGDEIEKNSQKVGLSYESYQRWDYAMKIAGTEMSACTTGLKTLTNTFDDASNGSAGAVTKFERLGLSMKDLQGLSREDLFATVVTALQNVSDETEKAALANDMFGKSGQELIPLFNMTQEELQGLMDECEEYGMIMSDDAVEASAAFQDALTRMQGTMTGIKNQLMGELLPGITQIMDGFSALAAGQEGAGEQIAAGVRETVGVINELIPEAVEVIELVASEVLKAAPDIVESLISGLLSQLPDLGSAALDLVLEITGVLLDNLDMILSSALTLVETLALGIADAAPELIPTVVDVALEMVDTLTAPEQLSSFINAALELILALVDGISKSAPRLYGEMPRLIIQLQSTLLASLPEILKVGVQIVMSLITGIINSWAELLKTGRQIIDKVKAGFDEKLKNVGQWGKDLIQGFINGILAKWNELKASVSNVVSSVKNIFTGKGGFNVHSPSKWAEDVFENVIAGAERGIDTAAPKMISSMQKAVNAVKDVVSMTASEAMTQAQYSAEQILSMAVGTIELDLAADLNGDGKVTAADAREAMRLSAVFDELSASFAGIAVPQAPVSAAAAASAARAEKVNENTYNYGGVYFTINAAEGQDPEEIAEIVAARLQEEYEREGVVYR